MKRLYLDTEFSALSQDAQLLSLALVADTGESFYAEFADVAQESLSDWVQQMVVPELCGATLMSEENSELHRRIWGSRSEISAALLLWLEQLSSEPQSLQVWADVSHYDWVLFADLFGGAQFLPAQLHYICMDIATMLSIQGYDPDCDRLLLLGEDPQPQLGKHNALKDAYVTRALHLKLTQTQPTNIH